MNILSVTLPFFCFLVGGVLLKRFWRLSEEVVSSLSRLTYYIAMPAMIFQGVSSFAFEESFRLDLVGHNLATTGILFCVFFGISILVRPKERRGAFHLSAFRSNIGYIGIPVSRGFYGDQAVGRVAVVNGFDTPFCIFLSVISLSVFRALQGEKGSGTGKALTKKLIAFFYNPFFLATLLGLLASYFRIPVMDAPVIGDLILLCASMAMPLALLSIGLGISFRSMKRQIPALIAICAIRLILAPALGYVLGRYVFSLSGTDLAIATLLTGTPVSVSSFVLAREMGADKDFSANAIGVSTLVSVLTLTGLQGFLTL